MCGLHMYMARGKRLPGTDARPLSNNAKGDEAQAGSASARNGGMLRWPTYGHINVSDLELF